LRTLHPGGGLALLDGLDADRRLARYQPLHAVRAELLRQAGDAAGADAASERAIARSGTEREWEALRRRRHR
jgi:predicted RNA polymerase sigma factor